MFDDKFVELAAGSEWGTYNNVSDLGQQKMTPGDINRGEYNVNRGVFGALPLIPADWALMKYMFSTGNVFVMKQINKSHILQPEFYDDWYDLGLPFFSNHDKDCRAGIMMDPYAQQIYTKSGASVETYAIVRASFCAKDKQAVQMLPFYPYSMVTAGDKIYNQDPNVVSKYVTMKIDPDMVVLGSVYPKFSKDWAQKVKVTITVADGAPKGIYVVAVNLGKYDVWFGKKNDVNYDAYKNLNGAPAAHFVLAVDQ
jgi:hypothetical protein